MSNHKIITSARFEKIANEMEAFHGIFSKIWQLGKPIENSEIPTAAIQFDKEGNFFQFLFNPEFFNKISDYTLKFVICHEILHVMLNHGYRGKDLHKNIANIAMDIVINESLVTDFGFDREKIDNYKEYCWYDTIFPEEIRSKKVLKEQSFEYYYELLMRQAAPNENGELTVAPSNGGNQKTVDTHNGFGEESNKKIEKEIEKIVSGELGADEADKLKNSLEKIANENSIGDNRGDDTGNIKIIQMLDLSKQRKKKKWETVIKKWTAKALRDAERTEEQWLRTNRRYASVKFDNVILPSEYDTEAIYHDPHKIELMFFLDTSRSCAHLAERFWKAANSLPTNKFKLHLCCFDTQVYKVDLKDKKLYGYGGTMFNILEDYVQKYKRENNNNKYVDACFVITDGIGTVIYPEKPERWHWFLTTKYKQCIPKESHVYMLEDFE
jgi:predicted metal-dependent peptidase